MNKNQPTLEELLFEAAVERADAVERRAFLDEACKGNPLLRSRLELLLEGHLAVARFLPPLPERPRPDSPVQPAREVPSPMIGRYKMLEKLGEGGFGEVWMAEQREPVKRRVALKIIKPGMDSKQVVARFEAERQALAMMDHPNIARILDAGMTGAEEHDQGIGDGHRAVDIPKTERDAPNIAHHAPAAASGRPYFIMELVRGIKITEYCEQNHLTTRQRLDLFIKVCQAVQHAHQKGIIHRDLKPSNVLVTVNDGVPTPKVIDFGIAKATQGELTDKTVFTHFQQFVGTPAYISPEQAEMSSLDIDTRADIYSLGVLLYELLVGQTPFDAKEMLKGGLDALRRIIREEEPLRPSTRLTLEWKRSGMRKDRDPRTKSDVTPGASQPTSPSLGGSSSKVKSIGTPSLPENLRTLIDTLRGDLDWIVMKCLEKDRARRYDTANGLAADIQRYLANEPVVARPPSTAYRIQKTWQRNRLAFSAAAAVSLALVAGLGASTWEALRAGRAETLASHRLIDSETARKEAEAVSSFLARVFRSPDPVHSGRNVTVAESLGRAVAMLDAEFAMQPALRAKLQATVADTFLGLGMPLEAIPLLERTRDYYVTSSGPEHSATLDTMHDLAVCYRQIGRQEEARSLLEQVLMSRRRAVGPDHPDNFRTMELLARTWMNVGREKEGLELFEELLARSRKVNGPDHPDTLSAMHWLALNYSHMAGRQDDAIRLCEAVVAGRRSQWGVAHAETLRAKGLLADIYATVGQRDKSAELFKEVMPLLNEKYGLEHPTRMDVAAHLGRWAAEWAWADRATNPVAAHALARQAETTLREVLPVYESRTNTTPYHLACVQSRLGGALIAVAFTQPTLTTATREPKLAEAEAVLLRAQAGIAGDSPSCRRAAIERLVRLYEAWGMPEKLADWKQRLAAFDQDKAAKERVRP